MSTKSIGLALGGGATKGFIHLGVLKYLEEHTYTITQITGTSIGAIIGTLYASGMTFKEIYTQFSTLKYTDLIDIDTQQGLVKGQKIIDKIASICGDIQFEELAIPLKIIATNIDTGCEKVFSTGSVGEAIKCSISIPGIFSVQSTSKDNERYVDGGLVNNLPICHLTSSHIIGVSCMGISSFQLKSHKKILGQKVDTTIVTLSKRVLYRSLNIMMGHQEDREIQKHNNILLIRPDIGHLSPFSLDHLDEAVRIGYNEAEKILKNKIWD